MLCQMPKCWERSWHEVTPVKPVSPPPPPAPHLYFGELDKWEERNFPFHVIFPWGSSIVLEAFTKGGNLSTPSFVSPSCHLRMDVSSAKIAASVWEALPWLFLALCFPCQQELWGGEEDAEHFLLCLPPLVLSVQIRRVNQQFVILNQGSSFE